MSPRKLFYGLVGLTGVLVALIAITFWAGQQQINQKINKLDRLNTDLVIKNQQIESLRQLEDQYNQLKPLAEKVSSVLPEQKAQDDIVAQVATIAQQSGLDLSGLTFDKTNGLPNERSQTQSSSIGGILLVPVNFQTIGNYQALQTMLSAFEKQERFMRVSQLDLSRDEEGKITAGVTLEVFFKP